MSRKELAQWHREQAEILESGKPLEKHICLDEWMLTNVYCKFDEYRIAPERKPIPDYDLTESEVKVLIEKGYLQIAQEKSGATYVYGAIIRENIFYGSHNIGENRYTGPDWRESLRTLKDYV